MARSYEAELVTGIACALHDAELAWYDRRQPGDLVPNPTPEVLRTIFIGKMPPKPDLALTLNYYDREQYPGTAVYWHLVQVKHRGPGSQLDALDYTGRIRDLLHEKGYIRLGEVVASKSRERSFADLGVDNSTPERREHSLNYGFMGLRPSA